MLPIMYFTMQQLGAFPITFSRSSMLQVIHKNSLAMATVDMPCPPPASISELSPWKMPQASFSTISMTRLLFAMNEWFMASLYDASILAKLHGDMSGAISKGMLVVESLNHSSRLKNVETNVPGHVKRSSNANMLHKIGRAHV